MITTMLTFKQFLEADMMDLSTMDAPQQAAPQQPTGAAPGQGQGPKLKGSLTDNEKRVLAVLSMKQMKDSPGRARDMLSGNQNLVAAIRALKLNFKAVDVAPDIIVINQTGIDLANTHGVTDPNSGELTDLGKKLAFTLPDGSKNTEIVGLDQQAAPAGGDMGGGMGDMGGGAPQF